MPSWYSRTFHSLLLTSALTGDFEIFCFFVLGSLFSWQLLPLEAHRDRIAERPVFPYLLARRHPRAPVSIKNILRFARGSLLHSEKRVADKRTRKWARGAYQFIASTVRARYCILEDVLAGRLLRHRTFAHRAAWDRSFREALLRAEQAPPQSSDSHPPRHTQ